MSQAPLDEPTPEEAASTPATQRRPYRGARRLLDRVLFPRHAAANLAVMRLLIGGFALWHLMRYRGSILRVCTQTAPEHFAPTGIARLLSEPLPTVVFYGLFWTTVVAAMLFVVGAFWRVSGPLLAGLLLFVLTYRQSFGFIYHTENLLVLHVLILGFSSSADVLSFDQILATKGRKWSDWLARNHVSFPSWRYGWPTQLMLLLTGTAYWVAGMAKLGRNGFDWVSDAHLLDHIGNNALRYHLFANGASPLTFVVYTWPIFVWPALSLISLVVELAAPLAILHERLALLLAAGMFGFHWGVLALMGIPFMYQLTAICYVPFIRWDKLIRYVTVSIRKRREAKGAPRG